MEELAHRMRLIDAQGVYQLDGHGACCQDKGEVAEHLQVAAA